MCRRPAAPAFPQKQVIAADWSIYNMGRSNNNDRRKSMNAAKTLTEVIISLALVAGCGYLLKTVADRTTVVGSCPFYQEEEEEPAEEEINPNKIIFENSYVASDDVKKGDLILVNEFHQYFPEDDLDSHLVSVNEKLTDKEITFYSGVDNFDSYGEMKVHETIFEPMNSMIEDFYNKTDITDIVIYGGYRSTEFQQSLYDDDLLATGEEESTRVAKAGFSEHETGYAFDFSKLPDYDYDGEGEYSWFTENCYKYGFILRYPEDKQDITKIQYEPWHFRYTGKAHAYYMTKNKICLEEYIDLLRRNYTYSGGQFLEFTDDDGQAYVIFFVPADKDSDETTVPVPSGLKYDISGNNVDGFIVTVYREDAPSAPAETETEPAQENETEAETEPSSHEELSAENA